MTDLNFKVEGEAQTAARFNAKTRQFSLVIDEPPALGGDDLGASPVEYMLAAYAGCINVVAHLTAQELGIRVRKLRISINGNINPARLLGQSDAERAGFKEINVIFYPDVDSSPELTEKWIKAIKNRCPINDNLAYPTPLNFNFIQKEQTVTV